MSGLRNLFLEGGEKGCVNPQSCFDSKTNSVDLFKKKKIFGICLLHDLWICEKHASNFCVFC